MSIDSCSKVVSFEKINLYVALLSLNCFIAGILLLINDKVRLENHALIDIVFEMGYCGLNLFYRLEIAFESIFELLLGILPCYFMASRLSQVAQVCVEFNAYKMFLINFDKNEKDDKKISGTSVTSKKARVSFIMDRIRSEKSESNRGMVSSGEEESLNVGIRAKLMKKKQIKKVSTRVVGIFIIATAIAFAFR